jgi:hypothetical protein
VVAAGQKQRRQVVVLAFLTPDREQESANTAAAIDKRPSRRMHRHCGRLKAGLAVTSHKQRALRSAQLALTGT